MVDYQFIHTASPWQYTTNSTGEHPVAEAEAQAWSLQFSVYISSSILYYDPSSNLEENASIAHGYYFPAGKTKILSYLPRQMVIAMS